MKHFGFALCQAGVEKPLLEELKFRIPGATQSFLKPGFVTFRTPEAWGWDFPLPSAFARVSGRSLGGFVRGGTAQDWEKWARALGPEPLEQLTKSWRLHVILRSEALPGDEPPERLAAQAKELAEARAMLRQVLPPILPCLCESPIPVDGDGVLTCVRVDSANGATGATWFVGMHLHRLAHDTLPWEGGVFPPAEVPSGLISRAGAKLLEALEWAGLEPRAGETAVEIGASPGGACGVLLERGLKVWAVDPAPLDPLLRGQPGLTWIGKPGSQLGDEDLPEEIDWLLLDVNTEPKLALPAIDHVIRGRGLPRRGALLTLKLTDPSLMIKVAHWVERVEQMGFMKVKARQLSLHRRELAVFATGHRS